MRQHDPTLHRHQALPRAGDGCADDSLSALFYSWLLLMSGGYMFHPSSTEAYRARSDSEPMGVTNHGWQCRWCLKRTAIVAGRKRNPHGSGFICVACATKGEKK